MSFLLEATRQRDRTARRAGLAIDWLPVALLLPLFGVFAVWYVAPLFGTVLNSFHPYELSGIRTDKWTLENYTEISTDPYYRTIFIRTLGITAAVAVASAVFVYPVALFIGRQKPSVQTYLLLIYITPWLVNVTVKAFGWVLLLGPGGIINNALRSVGLIAGPLPLMFNEFGVFIGLFHAQFIFVLLPVWAALHGLDKNIVYAAANLGAGQATIVRRIIVPLTLPALAAGLIINMTMSLSAFTTPALLGGSRTKVLSYLSHEINLVQLNWPLGAAAGVVLLALTLVPILLVRAFGRSRTT